MIAIENARLFEEVQARNRDLTALGDGRPRREPRRLISRSCSRLSLTVLSTSPVLMEDRYSTIARMSVDSSSARPQGSTRRCVDRYRKLDIAAGQTGLSEAITNRQPLQISDITKRPSNPLRDSALEASLRAALIVPLLGSEGPLGALVLQRRQQGEFSEATVSLMQSFADQSVIALENARLFEEIAKKSSELEIASQHKTAVRRQYEP